MPLVPKRLMIRRSERVRARSTCKAESRGHCHQIGERVSLHLSHHLTSVCLYCDLADVELATDLFIQQAGGYQATLGREAEIRALRDGYASLTPRERQVMALVASGLLNKQVGGELNISEITVKA